jgi:hypothetical protein
MMKILTAVIIGLILFVNSARAQEIDCNITIDVQNLTTEARENISDLEKKIEDYINTYRWTRDDFGGDKIKCSFDIFFQGSPSENKYTAQVFIGSQRKIYKSEKSSGVIRILDDKWEFSYTRNQPLYHNTFQYDPLVSFIDFYIYIILGCDYDTYKLFDGRAFYQQALDIASKARSGGGSSSGWEAKSSGTYNRVQFIEEITNQKYKVVREAFYNYHYKGLDLLSRNKAKAQENIFKAVESIGNFQNKINERSILIKSFFDTKYLELCDVFLDYPDKSIYDKLSKTDPSHQKNYDEYKGKRK